MKEIRKMYTDILEVCDKYKDEIESGSISHHFGDVLDMRDKALNHLMIEEWKENYGIVLEHDKQPYSMNYFRLRPNYLCFSYYGNAEKEKEKGFGRYISWSDSGKQPKNEWLFQISFSTGAYIFGDDYEGQQTLFRDFFDELKSYNPDYSDTNNKALYWKLENAKRIYDSFSDIYKKYQEQNKIEFTERKKERLKKELASLEN